MQVNYCDLCGTPLKENNYYSLYCIDPGKKNGTEEEYYAYIAQIRRTQKEICPTCKHIFDKMFELRLQRLSELSEEINGIYQLPSIKNPIERDNKKGKRGKEKK